MIIFGDRLKELRAEKSLTQGELADKLGVARNSIFSYETGRRIPDIEVLAKIAAYFGVTSDYLLGLEDARTHEVADISARTGLSERAVLILEAKHKLQRNYLLRDSNLLSWIIETTIRPLTFAEYLENSTPLPVPINHGEAAGTMLFWKGDDKYPDACILYESIESENGKLFPLSMFAETDILPDSFRSAVLDNYRAYEAAAKNSGDCEDVVEILRKFYQNNFIGNSKFLFNRDLGVGRVDVDLFESMSGANDDEKKSDNIKSMCDESLECVTTFPIAKLLDEVTFGELKTALIEIREKHMSQKESANAEE